MKKLIEEFGAQLGKALEIASAATLSQAEQPIHQVIIAGEGSAKTSADLVAAFTQHELPVPVNIISDKLPAYVSKHTLLIACAFAGDTGSSKDIIESARAKGAKVVVISADAQLQELARVNALDIVALPADIVFPRTGIGYMMVPLLSVLHHHGLLSEHFQQDIAATISLLKQETAEIDDRAKTMAFNFSSHLPVLYVDDRLKAVAIRAQQQVNENAKHLCHSNVYQELHHHEIAGWEHPASLLRNSLVVLIRTDYDAPQAQALVDSCKPVMEKKAAMVMDLVAKGSSLIAQALYLIHVFDKTSLYLAELNDVDLSKSGR